ncbi:hypothetical protein ACQKN7_02245 [Bacillus cereus]|nr:hypothetical protein [Bacillus cereus]MEC2740833.1 hypothetical protein [Bacillus cereus]MEC2753766.1 hypothetical protein [Bacillus cereus]MEC2828134.1 hypothetical protein [Bacillus cereus]
MNGILSASKIMTAAQVREMCAEIKNNPAVMFVVELEVKQKLRELNSK